MMRRETVRALSWMGPIAWIAAAAAGFGACSNMESGALSPAPEKVAQDFSGGGGLGGMLAGNGAGGMTSGMSISGGGAGGPAQGATCSAKCPAAAPAGTAPNKIPECAFLFNSGVLEDFNTQNITRCAVALACSLGQNPTKLELLRALRPDDTTGAFGFVSCVAQTRSTQLIPDPEFTADGKLKKLNGMRCAAGLSISDAAWITYTDDPADSSIEMANVRPLSLNNVCGTDPVGLRLDHLCGATGVISSVKAGADVSTMGKLGSAVFGDLTSAALGDVDANGKPQTKVGECTECHGAVPRPANATPPPKLCYNFAFDGFGMVCPLTKALQAQCGLPEGSPLATCADGEPPKCARSWKPNADGKSYDMSPQASCNDGSAPICGGSQTASCVNGSVLVPDLQNAESRKCNAITIIEKTTVDQAKLDFYFELKKLLGCPIVQQAPPPVEKADAGSPMSGGAAGAGMGGMGMGGMGGAGGMPGGMGGTGAMPDAGL